MHIGNSRNNPEYSRNSSPSDVGLNRAGLLDRMRALSLLSRNIAILSKLNKSNKSNLEKKETYASMPPQWVSSKLIGCVEVTESVIFHFLGTSYCGTSSYCREVVCRVRLELKRENGVTLNSIHSKHTNKAVTGHFVNCYKTILQALERSHAPSDILIINSMRERGGFSASSLQ